MDTTVPSSVMSWVVGANTMLGYGIMVSDICVTLELPGGRREYRDVLQKVHKVGESVAAGFAGNIPIGLFMIEYLRDFLRMSDEELREGMCWEPEWVAETFAPLARETFEQFPDAFKA